jgi:hypothetical protein
MLPTADLRAVFVKKSVSVGRTRTSPSYGDRFVFAVLRMHGEYIHRELKGRQPIDFIVLPKFLDMFQ